MSLSIVVRLAINTRNEQTNVINHKRRGPRAGLASKFSLKKNWIGQKIAERGATYFRPNSHYAFWWCHFRTGTAQSPVCIQLCRRNIKLLTMSILWTVGASSQLLQHVSTTIAYRLILWIFAALRTVRWTIVPAGPHSWFKFVYFSMRHQCLRYWIKCRFHKTDNLHDN